MIDFQIVVKEDRNILFPNEVKNEILAVQYDHNVTTLKFICPRYLFGEDISNMVVYINYTRYDNYSDEVLGENFKIDSMDDSSMTFEWTLTKNVTEVAGVVAFVLNVKDVDEFGNERVYWSSYISRELKVERSIKVRQNIVDDYPDIIHQLAKRLNELDSKIEGGNIGLPEITPEDEGKYLKVIEGEATWADISTILVAYGGSYEVTPKIKEQTLPTANTYLSKNMVVKEIPFSEVSNVSGGRTVWIGKEID